MDGDTFQVVSNKEEQAITSIDNFSGYIESDPELAKVNFPPWSALTSFFRCQNRTSRHV